MNGTHSDFTGDGPADPRTGRVTVKCTTNSLAHDLDVPWTKGAIFEFDSFDGAERWVEKQNLSVPGTLFLAEVPDGTGPVPVNYYVKYSSPDG